MGDKLVHTLLWWCTALNWMHGWVYFLCFHPLGGSIPLSLYTSALQLPQWCYLNKLFWFLSHANELAFFKCYLDWWWYLRINWHNFCPVFKAVNWNIQCVPANGVMCLSVIFTFVFIFLQWTECISALPQCLCLYLIRSVYLMLFFLAF